MCTFPSKIEANELLIWADGQNPGHWSEHSRNVAKVAEAIAEKSGLNGELAYVLGLLHDIGRYEGVRGLHHIYAGYELMSRKNFNIVARICLTHSFPYQEFGAYSGELDCSADEIELIKKTLSTVEYDDYDRLIQLCDAMGSAQGVCTIDSRIVDVTRRYGFNDYTLRKWDSNFALKEYFDSACSMNIYNLFVNEINETIFGETVSRQ